MIVSAMIFAGLTLLMGGLIGFLLGQARGRMYYEERLREAEASHAGLKSQLANITEFLRAAGLEPPSQSEQAPRDKARE